MVMDDVEKLKRFFRCAPRLLIIEQMLTLTVKTRL